MAFRKRSPLAAPGAALVEAENVDHLVDAMIAQAAVPCPTPAEAQAAHARVSNAFSLSLCAEKTLRLYRTLLEAAR